MKRYAIRSSRCVHIPPGYREADICGFLIDADQRESPERQPALADARARGISIHCL
jgi:hypothetical protein